MSILVLIAVFVVGVLIGALVITIGIVRTYNKDPRDVIALLNSFDNSLHPDDHCELEIENHESLVLLSNTTTGMFIAQGKTLEDALTNAQLRFPELTFVYKMPVE
jgi:hypothetical protein